MTVTFLQIDENKSACGDTQWKAAANTVRKKRNLDETGLEIIGCRHSIAQASVNMFYGEIYGYAHYLRKVLLVPRKVKFIWYDVICKFWPWLLKQDPTTASTMKPALSVMHAKAHSWTCQVMPLVLFLFFMSHLQRFYSRHIQCNAKDDAVLHYKIIEILF